MPDWLAVALLSLAGITLTVGGGVVGAVLAFRASKRAATVQAEANETNRENALIDQLQEELTRHRSAQDVRMSEQDSRMTVLEERNGILVDRSERYRDLIHQHRAHIWDGKPPPPPEWPEDLPR